MLGRPTRDVEWSPPVDINALSANSKTGEIDSEGTATIWFYSQSDIWGGDPIPQRLFTPVRPNMVPEINLLNPTELLEDDTGGPVRIAPDSDITVDANDQIDDMSNSEDLPPHRIVPESPHGETSDNGLNDNEVDTSSVQP